MIRSERCVFTFFDPEIPVKTRKNIDLLLDQQDILPEISFW